MVRRETNSEKRVWIRGVERASQASGIPRILEFVDGDGDISGEKGGNGEVGCGVLTTRKTAARDAASPAMGPKQAQVRA